MTDSSVLSPIGRRVSKLKFLQKGPLARLIGRKFEGIPDELVISSDVHFFSDVKCWLTGVRVSAPDVMAIRGRNQSQDMIQHGLRGCEIVYSMNADHLEFLEWAKKQGAKIIVDAYTSPMNDRIINALMKKHGCNSEVIDEKLLDDQDQRLIKCYHLADLILCPSVWTKEVISSFTPQDANKLRIVPYGSSIHFDGKRNKPVPLQIFFAGAEVIRKGIFELAEAVRRLQAQGLQIDARVAGLIPKKLMALPELKVLNFLGKLNTESMQKEYLTADCLLLPSFCEGFPAVVCEALVAGCPVIVSEECGAPIENRKEGIILGSHEPAEIASAIREMVLDRSFRESIAENAYSRRADFSENRWASDLMACIEELEESNRIDLSGDELSLAPAPMDFKANEIRATVIFDNFGPYHRARLRSVAGNFELSGIECFSTSSEYDWIVNEKTDFQSYTLLDDIKKKNDPILAEKISKILEEIKPDVVFIPGWASKAALTAFGWCVRNNVPSVIMSESNQRDATRNPVKEMVKRLLVSTSSAGFVGGSQHRSYLNKLGLSEDRISLGYDSVDNDYFAKSAAEIRANPGLPECDTDLPRRFFLMSCRFIEKKNLIRAIKAYSLYRRQATVDPWSLVIIGDGPLRSEIEMLIQSSNLGSHIHLMGFQQYRDLPRFYALASAFVHVSTVEQWGLVVNEAMASSLAVIVSKTCGCATDLVFDGINGFVVDPLEIGSIATAMIRVASLDEGHRATMGLESRRIVSSWGLNRFSRGFSQAIENSLRSPRRSTKFARYALKLIERIV